MGRPYNNERDYGISGKETIGRNVTPFGVRAGSEASGFNFERNKIVEKLTSEDNFSLQEQYL